MIKINIKNDCITIKGHAEYSDYGKDIVCASVSSIVITTVNAIKRLQKNSIEVIENNQMIIYIKKHNKTVDTLIINMIILLKELEKQYGKNIKINEEV